MRADRAYLAKAIDRLGGIIEQCSFESRINPGLGDDTSTVPWSNLGFVCLDNCVERSLFYITLLNQNRFQRAHAQLHL